MTDFHLVDVFATERYAGNQLAVVESDGTLDGDEMQAIAAEMGFSETTFVESRSPPYRVRIFTPTDEIPFAGHPTLGTAAIIRDHVADGTPEEVVLDLDVGEIPVAVGETAGQETYWMTQQAPEFGETLDHGDIADLLSLEAADLDADRPVQVVSTGLPTIVVPLSDRDALERATVDDAAYQRVTGDREAKNVLAFCADPRQADNDLAVRVFAPGLGVPEDPATGSSNGCLAGYLARHAYFGSGSVDARVEQGYEMGRPSLLHLAAVERGEAERSEASGSANAEERPVRGAAVDVEVGGRVVPVATGELL